MAQNILTWSYIAFSIKRLNMKELEKGGDELPRKKRTSGRVNEQ